MVESPCRLFFSGFEWLSQQQRETERDVGQEPGMRGWLHLKSNKDDQGLSLVFHKGIRARAHNCLIRFERQPDVYSQ